MHQDLKITHEKFQTIPKWHLLFFSIEFNTSLTLAEISIEIEILIENVLQ